MYLFVTRWRSLPCCTRGIGSLHGGVGWRISVTADIGQETIRIGECSTGRNSDRCLARMTYRAVGSGNGFLVACFGYGPDSRPLDPVRRLLCNAELTVERAPPLA